MLILSNEEIESLLTVDLALKSLERAYLGQAQGTAVNRPRSDLYLPGVSEGSVYAFKTMEGGLVESKIVALRLNSDTIRWQERENRVVKDKVPMAPGKKWVGLIELFSAETGEPLAMFPDGVIQRMRVAVTSALAAREMARQDASVMAIFGSGWQAGAHVPAFCAVRKLKKINAYSPTQPNRERFAKEMEKLVGVPVEPMTSAAAAAKDADMLVAATNAITRVIEPEWMKPGVHATCVKDCELGEETIRKADRVVIHARNFAPENYIAGFGDEKIAAHDPVDFIRGAKKSASETAAAPFWTAAPELKEVIGGRVAGRKSADEATCFINNIGLGIQFAAVGSAIYAEAKAKGLGKEIPTDWFLESVHP
ncbi:MAG TPA: ornithine cyclodeaminase family protein [Candidatus Binatia bacterium]|jgi:ornithine cyclodeaminase/alanine dehydrogenase-like protein (mu-crystallin family)